MRIGARLISFLLLFVAPCLVHAEYIDTFNSDISIAKDGNALIIERISYVFSEERHGIFRCLPTRHQDKASSFFKERYIDIEVGAVRMDSQEVPYTVDENRNELCIKIGDPDVTITGPHQYEITYAVGGAVSYEQYGGAEWYWNVTGNAWTVPIRAITARVSSVDPILLRERACYRGVVGNADSCQISTDTNGAVLFSGTLFNPGEGVTIAQALDRAVIKNDVRERFNMLWLISIFSLLVAGGSVYALYRYKTKFRMGRTIIPQYEPYLDVKPMYAGYLFDKRLDPRDITACIVYLAEQGFIKIRKTERKVFFFFEVDDYEMELLRPIGDITDQFEREIMALIFDAAAPVGSKMTLNELKTNYSQARENAIRISALDQALSEDLVKKGFFMKATYSSVAMWMFFLGISAVIVVAVFYAAEFVWVVLIVVIIFVSMLVAYAFGRRTRKGYEALDHLKGFKDFLRVTETQRYIFHNAPEKNAEQFMEFLPYAIAFGVEKEWAKTFEGITIPNPGWYDGGGSSMSTFNAVGLTQSLGGFSTAFAGTSASGSSASSGGGSSGGGGGGGGGGSW